MLAPAAMFFFLNIPVFVNLIHSGPGMTPWLLTLGGLWLAAVLSRQSRATELVNAVTMWALAYGVLSGVWALGMEQRAWTLEAYENAFTSAMFVTLMTALFSGGKAVRTSFAWLVVVAVVLVACMNVYEVPNPSLFVPLDHPASSPGRAASLYVNPNICAAALILGMLIGLCELPSRYRAGFVFVVLAGVLCTFSRAGILAWVVTVVAVALLGGLPSRRMTVYGLLAGGALLVGVPVALAWLAKSSPAISIGDITERVQFLSGSAGSLNDSADERLIVLRAGVDQFAASPLLGNGLEATRHWSLRVSTHNVYLNAAVDFGVVGLFIFPALVIAMVGRWSALRDPYLCGTAVFVLLWGLFNHNIMEDYFSLTAIAFFAARAQESVGPARPRDSLAGTSGSVVVGPEMGLPS